MKNFRKILVLILILILLPLTFSSCKVDSTISNEKKDELVIYVGYNMCSGNYDPCKGYGINGNGIFHSTLLKFNSKIEVTPDLATEYSVSEDRLKYTYKLRNDAKFSDGKSLTASDVAFTYLTAKNSGSTIDLTMLNSAVALDDFTVEFTLNKPFSTFVSTTALLGIVPKHAYNNENYSDYPVGSGPFKVTQLDKEQQLIIVPNEYYYGTKSPFKKITILNLDESTALANAKSGQLDLVMVNPEYFKETVNNMHIVSLPTVDNRGINLPVVPETTLADGKIIGNNITSDFAIRKALNIGINREKIISDALNGVGVPAYGRVDNLPWYNPQTKFEDNRVDEAKALLESAGWIDIDNDGIRERNGVKAEFKVTARTDDLQRFNLIVALSENAKALGINIKTEALLWAECKSNVHKTPTCLGSGDYNPMDLYHTYYSKLPLTELNNPACYKNEEVDKNIESAIAAKTFEESLEYWKMAQFDGNTGINSDYPFLWIVNIDHTYFVKDGLNIGNQLIHPHGHGVPVIANLNEWTFN